MRLDRTLTLHFFRGRRGPDDGHLPILMYHSISNDPETGVSPYYRTSTSPKRFSEQMHWLSELGYTGVSLEEAISAKGNRANGSRLVAITFDDGFRDFHTAAWPVLSRHKFTATMYLPTAFISAQRKTWVNRECLMWGEVLELRREGARFGSHTVNHPNLHSSSWTAIESELAQSKSHIENKLGESVSSFAYPFAFPQEDRDFVSRMAAVLQKCGYENCVTTVIGRMRCGDDLYGLKRLPVNQDDDRELFCAKLSGAYDWMSGMQSFVRNVRAWSRFGSFNRD